MSRAKKIAMCSKIKTKENQFGVGTKREETGERGRMNQGATISKRQQGVLSRSVSSSLLFARIALFFARVPTM